MSKNFSWIAVAVLAAGMLVTTAVNAGTPSIKEKGKVIELVDFFLVVPASSPSTPVFTVPDGQQFVLTDLIIANANDSAAASLLVFRAGNRVFELTVPAEDTRSMNFTSGVVFDEGHELAVANGADVGSMRFSMSGYTKKRPKD